MLKKYLLKFEIEEKELRQISEDIENSKLILSENEINIKIADYNKKLSNYTNMIEEFNYHYQNQIVSMRLYLMKLSNCLKNMQLKIMLI